MGGKSDRIGAAALLVATVVGSFVTSSCGEDRQEASAESPAASEAVEFRPQVDHPLVPLASVGLTVLEGSERDPKSGETVRLRVESRVLGRTEVVAGTRVAVVEVKDFEEGRLVEQTLDYYAQRGDGSVWYLGERVDDYEDGKLVGHEGQWLAGRDGARPGLFMPAEPKLGDAFEQERAPGVAEDRSTVVAVDVEVTTDAGTFSGCIKTEDFAPLDDVTEFKYYCRDIGLVREEFAGGRLDLVRYR
jgi:hypothetical protein